MPNLSPYCGGPIDLPLINQYSFLGKITITGINLSKMRTREGNLIWRNHGMDHT